MRGLPDRSSGNGRGARGVNDKVTRGEGAQAKGGAGARRDDQLGVHEGLVDR
jgi:hypothetical protein